MLFGSPRAPGVLCWVTWALRRDGFDLYITPVHVANSHILLGRRLLLQDVFTMKGYGKYPHPIADTGQMNSQLTQPFKTTKKKKKKTSQVEDNMLKCLVNNFKGMGTPSFKAKMLPFTLHSIFILISPALGIIFSSLF